MHEFYEMKIEFRYIHRYDEYKITSLRKKHNLTSV